MVMSAPPEATGKDLIADDLFGNEAGEDEDPAVLSSYFVEKAEFQKFYDATSKLGIVRARKGVGKSALLKQSFLRAQQNDPESILIYVKGSDLIALQPIEAVAPSELVYAWQQRICSRINLEISNRLQLAFSDDAITLIESTELAGFTGKNIVAVLLDRLKTKIGQELTDIAIIDPAAMLERFVSKTDHHVGIYIDDIDATFINTEVEKLKVSTFFSACRDLLNAVNGLVIRASVRTDVWALIRQHDEALDKCEQYSLDLRWSNKESEEILARKIIGYFKRKDPSNYYIKHLQFDPENSFPVLSLVFSGSYWWGNHPVPPDRPIVVLSAGRPRWAAQLCKMAANVAYKAGANKIIQSNIQTVMRAYGQARIDDLYREHRHQTSDMERLLECFAGGKSRYTTSELLQLVTDRIIKYHGMPKIDGTRPIRGSLDIAHFLYRIGFISGRDQRGKVLDFVRFEDRPNLLTSSVNLDDGLEWEIHPSYRGVLRLENAALMHDPKLPRRY